VIIDKTADLLLIKQLATILIFFSEKGLKRHVKILDMVKRSNGLADSLIDSIKQVIEKKLDSKAKYSRILGRYN